MYRITNVFSYIFGFLLLFLALLFLMIQNLIGNQRILDPALKWVSRSIPLCFGIRIKATNLPPLDPQKGYVFISNHVNLFDPMILYGHIPQYLRAVEVESHFSYPVWGPIIRRLGNIPISQKDVKSALKSLEEAGKVIQKGTSIVIFPEGHRTRTGELQDFKSGPFRIARNAGVDVVPMAMIGLWDRKTIHSKFVKPGKVELRFLEPIPAEEVMASSDKALRIKTRALIEEALQ